MEEHRTLTPVLCMDWDNTSKLYTGGDRGQVACWDFSEVIKELNAQPAGYAKQGMEKPNQRKISALPDSNTRKNVENAHLPSLSEKLVQFDWSVPAHGDSVSSLQYIHEPASILSASHDHTVRIWGVKGDERGKRIGSLLQELRGEQKHPQWLFNIDVEKIEKQRNKKTRDIIKVNEEFGRQMGAKKKSIYEQKVQDFPTDSLDQKDVESNASSKFNDQEGTKYNEESLERQRQRAEKNEEFSTRVNNSMAGSRLTELHHGGSQDMGEPNHHRKRSPRSESDSEDELDFDRIGFEEFKREWAASLRRMPSDGDSDAADDAHSKSKRSVKDSHFSIASTKAIRKRANRSTQLAALKLDEAIAQSKLRKERKQHRGNVKMEVNKLKERLKRYGF